MKNPVFATEEELLEPGQFYQGGINTLGSGLKNLCLNPPMCMLAQFFVVGAHSVQHDSIVCIH